MIRLECVTKRLGGQLILDELTLEIGAGEVVALVGPSGAGKSVLLKHVIGLITPDEGDVLVGGKSVVHAQYRDLIRLRQRMGYVFQDGALLDSLTIEENLRLALGDRFCRTRPEACRQRIRAALGAVNLESQVLGKMPAELSGGMRKRVAVARALLNQPEILLFDEPTTGLDPHNSAIVNQVVARTHAQGNTSIIITHDLSGIASYATRVVLMRTGQVRFDGSPAAFLAAGDSAIKEFIGRVAAKEIA
jgi:phospholipid/cholesterol/gamma-HCH transport system ATP-binding protein